MMTERDADSSLWDLLGEDKFVKLPEVGCHENVALQQVYQKYVDVSWLVILGHAGPFPEYIWSLSVVP